MLCRRGSTSVVLTGANRDAIEEWRLGGGVEARSPHPSPRSDEMMNQLLSPSPRRAFRTLHGAHSFVLAMLACAMLPSLARAQDPCLLQLCRDECATQFDALVAL